AERIAQTHGKDVAAGADADDRELGEIAVAFDDLVRDPRDGATTVVGAQQRGQCRLLSGLSGPVVKGVTLAEV
ncbi:MAG TPA: hypothetical protein VMQ78_02650, partial [Candidatus Limnocylindria bacterium]|nr:hypothetical protein [Candidatus Limnocylindria bacterium]